jgi:hypothetical protein
MKSMRIAAVAAVLTGASVGLAGPAYADPLSGSYTATVVSSMGYLGDKTATWVFTPCGPDCVRVSAQNSELHGQDGEWTGTFEVHDQSSGEVVVCTRKITASLSAADLCPKPASVIVSYQLTKIG